MKSEPIFKQDNELFRVNNFAEASVPGANGHPDILQQSLDFPNDKSPARLGDPFAHRGLEKKLVHPGYAAKLVLERLLAHFRILSRCAAGQVQILGAIRPKTSSRPSAGELSQRVMRGCQSLAGLKDRTGPQIQKKWIGGSPGQ